MWESKDQTLDINYNVAELWFVGVYGIPVPKPLDIKKWEEGKCYLLLDKNIPRLKADRMLQDLSQIALKYAQGAVHQRLTLKPNAKGENRAPVVFQYDSGGITSHGPSNSWKSPRPASTTPTPLQKSSRSTGMLKTRRPLSPLVLPPQPALLARNLQMSNASIGK
jgi:hypothetical protein